MFVDSNKSSGTAIIQNHQAYVLRRSARIAALQKKKQQSLGDNLNNKL